MSRAEELSLGKQERVCASIDWFPAFVLVPFGGGLCAFPVLLMLVVPFTVDDGPLTGSTAFAIAALVSGVATLAAVLVMIWKYHRTQYCADAERIWCARRGTVQWSFTWEEVRVVRAGLLKSDLALWNPEMGLIRIPHLVQYASHSTRFRDVIKEHDSEPGPLPIAEVGRVAKKSALVTLVAGMGAAICGIVMRSLFVRIEMGESHQQYPFFLTGIVLFALGFVALCSGCVALLTGVAYVSRRFVGKER